MTDQPVALTPADYAALLGDIKQRVRHAQTRAMLAQVCADNELGRLKLQRQLPNTGDTVVPCEQASRAMTVTLSVQPTPNPNFRRVDAQVSEGDARVLTVSTVMGRN